MTIQEDLTRVFSNWFNIIPFEEVEKYYIDEGKEIFLLRVDGTDVSISEYTLEQLEEEYRKGALFGIEK